MSTFTVTLPVSGVTLKIRRQPMDVVQSLQMKAMQKHTEPQPPMVREEVAPDQYVDRPDSSDVSYIEALRVYELEWKNTFGEMLLTVLARTCIIKDAQLEAIMADAESIRETYRDLGMTVPDDIAVFALRYCIAVSEEDINHLMMEVFGKTLPTQQQVAMRAAMFQGSIQTT
jgi:hypothetical protein